MRRGTLVAMIFACLLMTVLILATNEPAPAAPATTKIDLYPQDGSNAAGDAELHSTGRLRVGVQGMEALTNYNVLLSVDNWDYEYAGTFRTNKRGQGTLRLTVNGLDLTAYHYVEIRRSSDDALILKGSK